MIPFGECLGVVAPYYNLVFVLVVLLMFFKLFSIKNKKLFLLPWKLLFAAVGIYILEEMLTVFKNVGMVELPRIYNAVFEFFIISIFIYLLLVQKQYLTNKKNDK
ncbi:hypothetical protein GF323_03955 [Candidatus Woesearchaeota archaeon]|nr:hypothetical protein [Candidatus Woesearchaeota archaeon]